MTKITTLEEYYNIIIEILDKIYNLSNEENVKITGIKNKEQPYELKIKDILNEYCVEKINKQTKKINKQSKKIIIKNETYKSKYENIFFEYQPKGSQLPPDFMIYYENYEEIKIECKSSKNNKPVWNCSIPEKETIYVYYDSSNKKTYIFYGDEIIDTNDRLEIIKFNEELKILCNKFNKTTLCDKNICYYPRQMINQTIKMDVIISDAEKTFNKVKNVLLTKYNLENKPKIIKEKKNKSTINN